MKSLQVVEESSNSKILQSRKTTLASNTSLLQEYIAACAVYVLILTRFH